MATLVVTASRSGTYTYCMPRRTLCSSAGLLVALGVGMVLGCSPDGRHIEPGAARVAITDGTEDSAHPEVGLLLIDASGGTAQNTCTAFLIEKQAVLTAAHCLDGSVNNLFELDGKLNQVTQVIPHGSWDPSVSKYEHDIGLALLQDPVSGVAIPSYGTVTPAAGMEVTLVGFGRTAETLKDSGKKRVAANTIEAVSTGYFTVVGTGGGEGNICHGDSGGPVYNKTGVALGVISADQSPYCLGTKSYHVTIEDYLAWIAGKLSPTDTTAPKVTITGPTDGATVATSVLLEATVTDNVAVASVEALVDDAAVDKVTAAPYRFSLTLSPGVHVLKVVALDPAGNSAEDQISVTATAGPVPDGGFADSEVGGDGLDPDRPRGVDGCAVMGSGGGGWPVLLPVALLLLRRRRRGWAQPPSRRISSS